MVNALERVVSRCNGALAADLERVLGEIRMGTPVSAALDAFAQRTGVPVVARFASGLVNRSFEVTDLQVRDFGTAAVGIGVLAQETSWQGGDNSGRFRVTLVAVQAAEGWRLAHVHIGPLHMPPGGAS